MNGVEGHNAVKGFTICDNVEGLHVAAIIMPRGYDTPWPDLLEVGAVDRILEYCFKNAVSFFGYLKVDTIPQAPQAVGSKGGFVGFV